MYGLFSRPARRTRPARVALGSRLRLEHLETRDCPAAPVLTSTSITALGNGQVQVQGVVQDDNPTSAVIHLSGAAQGDVHPDATGHYSVQVTPSGGGAIVVQAADPGGAMSGTVSMPQLTLDATQEGLQITNIEVVNEDGSWVIRGTVTGGVPDGTTVRIGSTNPNLNGETTAVDGTDGSFQIDFIPGETDLGGTISITATDVSGQTSLPIIKTID
jgi:hypothetical protein